METLAARSGHASQRRSSARLRSVQACAVIYVRHLDSMRSFYRECFGLEPAETAEDYSVLESAAWVLSLVVIPDTIASAFPEEFPPSRREETPIKLAFQVQDIEILRPVMAALGGRLDPADTQWNFRGRRHCDGVDPEGNVLQITEPLP
jgi:predicted enzyme related to lactoylglutathione lyase